MQIFVDYATLVTWNNRVTGCVDLILNRMGVMLMDITFGELMQFGIFLIALLTFIFSNRK